MLKLYSAIPRTDIIAFFNFNISDQEQFQDCCKLNLVLSSKKGEKIKPAMVAERSKSSCFKFKWRQRLRSQVRIPLEAKNVYGRNCTHYKHLKSWKYPTLLIHSVNWEQRKELNALHKIIKQSLTRPWHVLWFFVNPKFFVYILFPNFDHKHAKK